MCNNEKNTLLPPRLCTSRTPDPTRAPPRRIEGAAATRDVPRGVRDMARVGAGLECRGAGSSSTRIRKGRTWDERRSRFIIKNPSKGAPNKI